MAWESRAGWVYEPEPLAESIRRAQSMRTAGRAGGPAGPLRQLFVGRHHGHHGGAGRDPGCRTSGRGAFAITIPEQWRRWQRRASAPRSPWRWAGSSRCRPCILSDSRGLFPEGWRGLSTGRTAIGVRWAAENWWIWVDPPSSTPGPSKSWSFPSRSNPTTLPVFTPSASIPRKSDT